jgi:phosphotransferase system IIB component
LQNQAAHTVDHEDKQLYFDRVDEARSLQNRWKEEAGVDVIGRVIAQLQALTNMQVRVATEDDREYFAGITRAVDRGIGVHADFAPYVGSRGYA